MSRTKRLTINITLNSINHIITMVSGFLISRLILQYYGSEINGLISSITQFFVYFKLLEFGLSNASIYSLYKPISINDTEKINSIVTATKILYNRAGYIFVVLTILLSILYPIYVNVEGMNYFSVLLLIFVLGFNIAIDFFTMGKYTVLLTANQRNDIISIASIVYMLVLTLIVYLMAVNNYSILLLRSISLVSIIVRSLILFVYVKVMYRNINFKAKPDFSAVSNRKDSMYLQVLGTIHSGAPIVLLTILTKDLLLISIFTVYNMIISGVNGIISMITQVAFPTFGDVISKNQQQTLKETYSMFELLYYMILALIYSVTFVTIKPFIILFTSGINDAQYTNSLLVILFVFNGFLFSIKNPQGMLVMSAGLYKETRLQTTIQGAIIVVFALVLIPYFGIVGALIASILSNLYRDIDLLLFIPKNVTKLSYWISLKRIILSLISVVFVLTFSSFIKFPIGGYLDWITYSIIISVLSGVLILLVFVIFDRPTIIAVTKRFKKLLKR